MKWHNTDGFSLIDFSAVVEMDDDYELIADEKRPVVAFASSEASKTLTLGIGDGEAAIIVNVGDTNAVTVKNVSGDTGTSIAKGKAALVVGSTTADASTVLVLN